MLAHKSLDVRPELWRRARINAELSGVALRDYLAYLLSRSEPVDGSDVVARQALAEEVRLNRQARSNGNQEE